MKLKKVLKQVDVNKHNPLHRRIFLYHEGEKSEYGLKYILKQILLDLVWGMQVIHVLLQETKEDVLEI